MFSNFLNTPVPNSICITMSINHNLEFAFWYLI
jgi:hypothetical protein